MKNADLRVAFARRVIYGGDGPVVLASASPRRRRILEGIGLAFVVDPPEVPERRQPGEPAERQVLRLAAEKALSVVGRHPGRLVIAADTLVLSPDGPLGKPADAREAAAMLAMLSGRTHTVITGVATAMGERVLSDLARTEVTFRSLTADEIDAYVETGEPLDKAGAYGAQALGSTLIKSIRGCYFNVVGLPVSVLLGLIRRLEGRA